MLNSTRTRLILVGILLCVALFVFVGCPDGGGTNGAARPVITLRGENPLLIDIGAVLSESDFGATVASANDPAYAGPVIVAIIDSSGTTVPTIDTAILGSYIVTYTAPADAAGNTPIPVIQAVRVGDATSPVITLVGSNPLLIPIGGTFTDPGASVSDNDPNYPTTMATPMITDDTDPTGIEIITISTAVAGTYTITYTAPADAAENIPTPVTRMVRVSIDIDGDTLIDMYTLDDLNAIHNDLDGTSYQATADGTELQCGTDGTTACTGYELMRDLNFANGDSYASGTVNADWRPAGGNPATATNAGWDPIGGCNTDINNNGFSCGDSDDDPFTATFEGNGFTIANLYVRRGGDTGLFKANSGTIRRIGVVNALFYGDTGSVNTIGGLVGRNAGTITASYATGSFAGGTVGDTIGGLVGDNNGTITASYATGDVAGGSGMDFIGGLVGDNNGTITASYATGDVAGGSGSDFIGGLVGENNGTITASYATGDIDGGTGDSNRLGRLAGRNTDDTSIGTIFALVASYGFGTRINGVITVHPYPSDDASTAVGTACDITEANSSTLTTTPDNRWDPTQWDFGTTMQRPVVLYEGVAVRGQTDRRC